MCLDLERISASQPGQKQQKQVEIAWMWIVVNNLPVLPPTQFLRVSNLSCRWLGAAAAVLQGGGKLLQHFTNKTFLFLDQSKKFNKLVPRAHVLIISPI